MSVIYAKPVFEEDVINIKLKDYSICLSLNHSGITYSLIIKPEDIKIENFDIKIYYDLINDILNNGKGTYKMECSNEHCVIHLNLKIDGYVSIEYDFSLKLTPNEKVTDIKILNYQIELLKHENQKFKEMYKSLRFQIIRNNIDKRVFDLNCFIGNELIEGNLEQFMNDDIDVIEHRGGIGINENTYLTNPTHSFSTNSKIVTMMPSLEGMKQVLDDEYTSNWPVKTTLSLLNTSQFFYIGVSNVNTYPIGLTIKYTNELVDDRIDEKVFESFPQLYNGYKTNTKYNIINIDYDVIGIHSDDKTIMFETNIKFKTKLTKENGIIYLSWKDKVPPTRNINYLIFKNNVSPHRGAFISEMFINYKIP